MALWFDETYEGKIRFGLRLKRSLFHGRSEYQSVDVVETEEFGRALALEDAWMTSERDEAHYHEMIVHPALTTAPSIRRVLVIGGGDGGSVREVLRYPEVESVVMVELDKLVVDVCKEHLPSFGVPWNDPRLDLSFGDGIAWLREYEGEPFDVIIIDGSDPVGPAEGLYATPFYESAKRCLTKQGVLVSQTESPIAMAEHFARIVKTLRTGFKRAEPYFVPIPLYPSGMWSFTFAADNVDPLAFDAARATRIEASARYYNRDIHRAAFAQPSFVRTLLSSK
ncbi:MAG TPA: polyamine aminopropyltransferase [Polyangiales bacterium]|nr:polyamine aminopropyltransferase [Polyangiales bacterium]